MKDLDGDVILKPPKLNIFSSWQRCEIQYFRGSLYKSPMFGGDQTMQIYGKFDGFPYDSALFGLGNIMSTVFLPQFDLKKGT